MDPIVDDLNAAQREAVEYGEGPLMVIAGAGSGKTRVITRRVARLLRSGVPSHSILALTFTNKAAGEMARRVLDVGGGHVHVATFHSACARFFDPFGHLLPTTIHAKKFLQQCWRDKLDWKTPVSPTLQAEWMKWANQTGVQIK